MDIVDQPAITQLGELVARRVSARELLDAHLARHDEVHPTINAVVATDLDTATAAARATDDARARGAELGPLAGLPMTVKDGFDVVRLPAVAGNPRYTGRPRDCADADLVARLRAAGAIPWGKTNVPLMLGDLQTYNAVYGTTNHPLDPARTPGGSSGGAAAALAAGVTPLELGSDIGGSLRQPAHFCGVYALKTTWGALSMRGHVPPPPGKFAPTDLGVAGPLARTPGDLRLMQAVLRGSASSHGDVRGRRVALWLDEADFALAGDARAGVEAAAAALRARGVVVEPARPPLRGTDLLDAYLLLLFSILVGRGAPEPVYQRLLAARPDAEQAVAAGANRWSAPAFIVFATSGVRDVARAEVARQAMKDGMAAFFRQWDAVLAPVTPVPAFPHRQEGPLAERVIAVDGADTSYLHLLDWVALASALHLPAVAAPTGRTADGLPVGAQLIGPWDGEDGLLDLAEALADET